MRSKVLIAFLAALLPASLAVAQDAKVEISPYIGYTFSEGVDVDPVIFNGVVFDHVGPSSGMSYGFAVDVFVTPEVQVGFQFGQQDSTLKAEGNGDPAELNDFKVNTYHGTVTYNFLDSREKARPFIYGGLGATQYSPGDTTTRPIDGETQFSATWGGGIKVAFSEHLGVKLSARWTPTYIKSDPAGIWCSPYWWYSCWIVGDTDYSNQFEMAAAVMFRF